MRSGSSTDNHRPAYRKGREKLRDQIIRDQSVKHPNQDCFKPIKDRHSRGTSVHPEELCYTTECGNLYNLSTAQNANICLSLQQATDTVINLIYLFFQGGG